MAFFLHRHCLWNINDQATFLGMYIIAAAIACISMHYSKSWPSWNTGQSQSKKRLQFFGKLLFTVHLFLQNLYWCMQQCNYDCHKFGITSLFSLSFYFSSHFLQTLCFLSLSLSSFSNVTNAILSDDKGETEYLRKNLRNARKFVDQSKLVKLSVLVWSHACTHVTSRHWKIWM